MALFKSRDRSPEAGRSGTRRDHADQLPRVLTMSLVYTSGLVFPPEGWTDQAALGTLTLMIWLRALEFHNTTGARMVVVERDPRQGVEDIRETEVATADLTELSRLLEQTGLPERDMRLETIADTSDRWAHLTLHAGRRTARRSVDLDIYASSYAGEDAPALKACFSALLRTANVRDGNVWYDLTGVWRRKA